MRLTILRRLRHTYKLRIFKFQIQTRVYFHHRKYFALPHYTPHKTSAIRPRPILKTLTDYKKPAHKCGVVWHANVFNLAGNIGSNLEIKYNSRVDNQSGAEDSGSAQRHT